MKELVKYLQRLGVLAISAIVFVALAAYFFLSAPFSFPDGKIFEVEKGASLSKIAEKLDDENIIRSEKAFILLVRLFKDERNVKAGLYYFERPLGLIEVASRLARGESGVGLVAVTIREGETLRDIGLIFESKGMFQAEAILKYASLEGYLFPDTYFFPPGIKPEDVIQVMRENFDKKLTPELRLATASRGKTISEIITMASIIEREANDSEDRKIISGILWKRTEAGMALQADATLNYLTGKKSAELTVDDLAIDSTYNTYKYPGLPLSPISNPGLESIKAAIFPENSVYWYYLHDSEGNAYYAETFEEHKENKIKYLR